MALKPMKTLSNSHSQPINIFNHWDDLCLATLVKHKRCQVRLQDELVARLSRSVSELRVPRATREGRGNGITLTTRVRWNCCSEGPSTPVILPIAGY